MIENERDTRQDDEEPIVVLKGAEGCAIVSDMHDRKKIRDDDVDVLGAHQPQNERLRDLVQRVERKREQQNVFHSNSRLLPSFAAPRLWRSDHTDQADF